MTDRSSASPARTSTTSSRPASGVAAGATGSPRPVVWGLGAAVVAGDRDHVGPVADGPGDEFHEVVVRADLEERDRGVGGEGVAQGPSLPGGPGPGVEQDADFHGRFRPAARPALT